MCGAMYEQLKTFQKVSLSLYSFNISPIGDFYEAPLSYDTVYLCDDEDWWSHPARRAVLTCTKYCDGQTDQTAMFMLVVKKEK